MEIAQYLAKNIAQSRFSRGYSQSDLARLSGIPRSTINHLESGSGNPSLQNLIKLSQALKVSVEELLARPLRDVQLVKACDLKMKTRARGMAEIFNLLPAPVPGAEFERLVLKKDAVFAGTPHLKGTLEFFVCIAGKIEVSVLEKKYLVAAGDVLVFPGDEKHAYRNRGNSTSSGISAVIL